MDNKVEEKTIVTTLRKKEMPKEQYVILTNEQVTHLKEEISTNIGIIEMLKDSKNKELKEAYCAETHFLLIDLLNRLKGGITK